MVARKINREGVVLLGWGRAILLQLAHPLVAAGVAEYSDFNESARGYVRRVRRTVGGMLAITFGTPDQARQVIERINGVHDRVHGVLSEPAGRFPAGTRYSARDPQLLLWVHATLVESMVLTYEQLVAPLAAAERDRFCVEAAETAVALGVPPADVPMRYDELCAYMKQRYAAGDIVVTPRARRLAAALLSPPLGPAAAPLARITKLVTVGLLPDDLRRGYGFAWDDRRDRVFRAIMLVVRRTRWILPPMLREWRVARAA
jgi:uncharacterized protein (DUF2236 family)